jgi:hypothetical protein
LKLEHFTYALYNGQGYVLDKTNGVDSLLKRKTLRELCALNESKQQWCPTEQVVACTHVEPVEDEFGRAGVWNHTILMTISDYLTYTQPVRLMEPYFLKRQEKPTGLEPLQIGV